MRIESGLRRVMPGIDIPKAFGIPSTATGGPMSHEARMMLLFASAGNPLWKDLISGDITENKIADYLGIVRMTLTNWKKTESLGRKPAELFGTVKDHIREAAKPAYVQRGSSRAGLSNETAERALAKVDEFHGLFRSSRYPHIYEAANVLGIGVKDCQQIIDHSHYTQLPLFPRMYYLSRSECEKHFKLYAGLYHVWVKRYRAAATFWFRCPMEVRYVLKMKAGHVIRCKLNFPMIERRGNLRYWEYDGFIAITDINIFWMFERRPELISSDYFQFITDLGFNYSSKEELGETLTMTGRYLTTDQNAARTITNGEVIIQKLDADRTDEAQVGKIMHGDAAVFDRSPEREELDRFLRELEQSKEPPDENGSVAELRAGRRRARQG
jgi:hypothetical protein